ncbi:hypothetical protein AGLY_008768 [Aphis glycines]|uniref:Peptidase A2 domain-containing protein n=1 Tax=Aphis glycines TaxID=307491 RepID=A0A6G0TJW9_APHGL|nr:hypothetical protein AGLY_008768 [Aphis glycines]
MQFENKIEHAILDTGSNISCIECSLIKNKEEIIPEKIKYEIKAYVLKGLICGFLLSNNFCFKYGLVIDLGKKEIKFNTRDSIKMDKIWAEHNGPPTISTLDEQSAIHPVDHLNLTNKQLEKAKAPINLNCAKLKEYEVKLSSKDPVFQAPCRVSTKQREKLKKIIDEMINANIIEPKKSSYAPSVFLISKKQKGEYRFLEFEKTLYNY